MKKMWKRIVSLVILANCAIALLAGCGGAQDASKEEVNLMIWTEYIPDSVIEGFEKETGVVVNMTTYASPDEMLAKLKSSKEGTYDMIICPENYVPIFSGDGTIEELDKSKLSNMENLDPSLLGRENDPENTFSLPYMFATAVIAVDTDVISEEIDSYDKLLNEAYKDQIVAIEDSRAMYAMAAMAKGFDANDTSDEALAAVEDYWSKLFPNIHVFDGTSPKTEMINGECPIGLMYGAEALLAQKEVPSIKCYYPKEGTYMGADAMMITSASGNKENAYTLMNYIMDGDVSAAISAEFPYVNPNLKALNVLGSDYADNILTNPPTEAKENSCTLKDIGDETSKIVNLWTKLKG
ncbi:MAG: spermidine/putrescine ABC transporter substrate-binding protein [Pseudobutyrivibrio sp.]|nr:spermidine/putrescine ABC transporter substrate-binding protein [Pseudobutyrivibrio sp.]